MSCSVPEAIRRLYKMFKSTIRLINLSSYMGRCLIKIGTVTDAEEPDTDESDNSNQPETARAGTRQMQHRQLN